MVICITGMHRSGTSMIARLLNLCGVYLGQEADLIPAAGDNSEGYWENLKFQSVNEQILDSFGGSWDIPPSWEVGWEMSPHLLHVRPQVDEFINEFYKYPVWGWKDPRSSLTLPYWRKLFPDLKVVVCLRNPYDVYHSLARRSYASSFFAYNLWMKYSQSILDVTDPKNRLVTHFDSYFHDPHAELRRVVDSLGLNISDEMINIACEAVSSSLKHSDSSLPALLRENTPVDLIGVYKTLCGEAGPVYRMSLSSEDRELLDTINLSSHETPADYEPLIRLLKFEIKQRDLQIQNFHQTLAQKDQEFESLQGQMNLILASRSWKLVEFIQKIKSFFS